MAQITRYPTGDGSSNEGTPSTGSDHYAMVDETSADDDTTYLSSPGGGVPTWTERFTFDFSAIGDDDTIDKITIHFRARIAGGTASSDDMEAIMYTGSLTWGGADEDLTTSYADFSHEFTTGLPSDGSDLKTNYELGVRGQSGNFQADDNRVTQVYVVVDYTPNNAASDDRDAKVHGEDVITSDRSVLAAGGDGRYVEDFSTTTKKDSGNTTASWTGDGTAELG